MSDVVMLNCKPRQVGRKGPSRRLRREGQLPGMIYGHGENIPVSVSAKEILRLLEIRGGSHSIIHSKVEGDNKERSVMIKALDVHPIYDTLIHIDLLEIDEKKPMKLEIELEFSGVPVGVKEKGGEMRVHMKKLLIQCLPKDIPARLVVNVKDMDLGQTLNAKDVAHDQKVTVLTDPEAHVVSVAMPKAVKAEAAPAEAAAAAPAAGAPATAPAAAPAVEKTKAAPAKKKEKQVNK